MTVLSRIMSLILLFSAHKSRLLGTEPQRVIDQIPVCPMHGSLNTASESFKMDSVEFCGVFFLTLRWSTFSQT